MLLMLHLCNQDTPTMGFSPFIYKLINFNIVYITLTLRQENSWNNTEIQQTLSLDRDTSISVLNLNHKQVFRSNLHF